MACALVGSAARIDLLWIQKRIKTAQNPVFYEDRALGYVEGRLSIYFDGQWVTFGKSEGARTPFQDFTVIPHLFDLKLIRSRAKGQHNLPFGGGA